MDKWLIDYSGAQSDLLRSRAERAVAAKSRAVEDMSLDEVRRLVHELQVHQVELEMQNENLLQTQAELAQSRDRFNELYDFAPVGYVTLDKRGTIREANLTSARMLDLERSLLPGKPINHFVMPASHDALYHHLRMADGEGKQSCELSLRRRDGSGLPVLIETIRMEDPVSRTALFQSALIDIAARKQSEELLAHSESFHRQVLESIPGMVFTARPDGFRDYASGQWEVYTGVPLAQQMGDGWWQLLHPDDREGALAARQAAVSSRSSYDLEYRLRRRDGQYEWFRVVARPIRDENGELVRWLGVALNVERLKRAEQELRDADRRKDEFVATLAHELRNPLAPIRNAAALLTELGIDHPTLRWAHQVIEKHVTHICRLVDDLLDVARITGNKILLKTEELDLTDTARQAVETSQSLIRARGHRLEVKVPEGPVPWKGDPVRLVQVLVNLLDNAAKYTPEGGLIQLRLEQDEAGIEISVRDNGSGISPQLLPHVFEVFQQGERTLDRSQGGLGLGLTLVKQLVELHGGHIEASSAGSNRGSVFTIHLPPFAGPPGQKPPPIDRHESERRFRVLVVDDEGDIAESMAMLLRRRGHEVETAHDAPAALTVASAFHPQVVLLDIGLPGMDGIELARRLRDVQTADTPLYVIAVSGYGDPHTRELADDAGFDRYLVKPVSASELNSALAQHPTLH